MSYDNNNQSLDALGTITINAFDEPTANFVRQELERISQTNIPVVKVYIDSYGGQAYSLFAMVDMFSHFDRPICTISNGKSMSCGSVLLSCGTKGMRFASPNALIMIHDVVGGQYGKEHDLKVHASEVERINCTVFSILDSNSGHKPGFFRNMLNDNNGADIYLTAEQSLKLGLIDYVGLPDFKTKYMMEVVEVPSPWLVSEKQVIKRIPKSPNKLNVKKNKK